jgi:diaminopimelate epimerase
MGEPLFGAEEIPLRTAPADGPILRLTLEGESLSLFPLFTGSTHAVIFEPSLPEDARFLRLSPQIEHHPLFPERTSVLWTQVLAADRLRIRIWERGVGETWGCGTGACAAAVAAQIQGYAGAKTVVESRGGELEICWMPGGRMRMTGPAETVFTGLFPAP